MNEHSKELKVLDHGYVRLVESWGSDERIIEAARMSTSGAFRGWGPFPCDGCESTAGEYPCCDECKHTGKKHGDEKLLRYLWEHKHATPFEMAGLIVEVQAPIFVFREWHRHRTQSYNELSARYTEVPELFYVPSLDRLRYGGQGKKNKQGSGEELEDVESFETIIRLQSARSFETYKGLLECGVSRELARLVLPVNTYSRMRASANLRNWLAFLSLRLDPAAQWEIRQYAEAVGTFVSGLFPRTWGLFAETSPK